MPEIPERNSDRVRESRAERRIDNGPTMRKESATARRVRERTEAFLMGLPVANRLLSEALTKEEFNTLRIDLSTRKMLDKVPPVVVGSLGVMFKRAGRWVGMETPVSWTATVPTIGRNARLRVEDGRPDNVLRHRHNSEQDVEGFLKTIEESGRDDAQNEAVLAAVRDIVARIRDGDLTEKGDIDLPEEPGDWLAGRGRGSGNRVED